MNDFLDFYRYWDGLVEDWSEDPETTIRDNVYLSKYQNPEKSPLYKDESSGFEYYKYLPEAYFGDPENCCAVILNLNPGFGISSKKTETEHPDYKLLHIECSEDERLEYDRKRFVPYLAGKFVDDAKRLVRKNRKVPGGVFWWYGTYNKQAQKCTGGRIDYIHHLYRLYFGKDKTPDRLPLGLEICPWRSYSFSMSHIFPDGIPTSPDDDLVKTINDYVLVPALLATKGKDTLPFVICIGSVIKELHNVLGLKVVAAWDNTNWMNSGMFPFWPKRLNDRDEVEDVVRTYTLYEKDGCYLLNTYAPGSNKPPKKETFQVMVEPAIVEYIRNLINS